MKAEEEITRRNKNADETDEDEKPRQIRRKKRRQPCATEDDRGDCCAKDLDVRCILVSFLKNDHQKERDKRPIPLAKRDQ